MWRERMFTRGARGELTSFVKRNRQSDKFVLKSLTLMP